MFGSAGGDGVHGAAEGGADQGLAVVGDGDGSGGGVGVFDDQGGVGEDQVLEVLVGEADRNDGGRRGAGVGEVALGVQRGGGGDGVREAVGQGAVGLVGHAGEQVDAEPGDEPRHAVGAAAAGSRRGAGAVEQDDGARAGRDEVLVGAVLAGGFGGDLQMHPVSLPRAGRTATVGGRARARCPGGCSRRSAGRRTGRCRPAGRGRRGR